MILITIIIHANKKDTAKLLEINKATSHLYLPHNDKCIFHCIIKIIKDKS